MYDPTISEGWWRLILAYQQMGLEAEAEATIKKAQEQGIKFSAQEQARIREFIP